MSPFFSICIPVYNGEKYLYECLCSIEQQTYKDFEVVIVDDVSADRSSDIISEFTSKISRLIYIKNEVNLGLVGNWNKCISVASGKWIKFLFQDDIWTPDCLEKTFSATDKSDFIFHSRSFIIHKDVDPFFVEFYGSDRVNKFKDLVERSNLDASEVSNLIIQNLGFNFFGEPSNVAFRKELVVRYGLFNPHLIQLCDYEFWARISSNTGAYYIADKLSSFRVHGKATSASNALSMLFRFKYLDMFIITHNILRHSLYRNLRTFDSVQRIEDQFKKTQRSIMNFIAGLPPDKRKEVFLQLKRHLPSFYYKLIVKISIVEPMIGVYNKFKRFLYA